MVRQNSIRAFVERGEWWMMFIDSNTDVCTCWREQQRIKMGLSVRFPRCTIAFQTSKIWKKSEFFCAATIKKIFGQNQNFSGTENLEKFEQNHALKEFHLTYYNNLSTVFYVNQIKLKEFYLTLANFVDFSKR